ncbi:MAG: CDP-diacylglycerol--serine O-phosphatidyltransferase [Pseudomonadota bacterium]
MSERKRPKSRTRQLPLRFLAPNMLTVTAICAGLFAILYAIERQFGWAVVMVFIAAILDGLDGRIARLFKSASAVGAELDSLADFLNFGVVPSLVLYLWSLQALQSFGWIVVLLYVVTCALRLARFNVMSREDPPQPGGAKFFVGVPAPAGALLAFLPMFISLANIAPIEQYPEAIAIYLACIATLMLSRVPTFSFKRLSFSADYSMFILLGVAATVALLVTRTWFALILIDLAYLLTIPFAIRAHARENATAGKVVLDVERDSSDRD